VPSSTSNKEVLSVGRNDYQPYSILFVKIKKPYSILKGCTEVFYHPAMPYRKLLDMAIVSRATRPKMFIVNADRD
jgi:hypothetical protein